MSKRKILIVEDNKNISNLVRYNLEKAGFDCHSAFNGEDVFNILKKQSFDLIVLDIMLPQMDGFEVCKHLKKNRESAQIPIIMLTAKGEEVDRIVGFELGADDYVVKPFSPRELVLRVKAGMCGCVSDMHWPRTKPASLRYTIVISLLTSVRF